MGEFFCSTSLPLASNRWVWSTFSSRCPLSSKHGRRLTSVTSTIFSYEIILGMLGIKPVSLSLNPTESWAMIFYSCQPKPIWQICSEAINPRTLVRQYAFSSVAFIVDIISTKNEAMQYSLCIIICNKNKKGNFPRGSARLNICFDTWTEFWGSDDHISDNRSDIFGLNGGLGSFSGYNSVFPLFPYSAFLLPDLLASHFCTDWLSCLGLCNQLGSITDHPLFSPTLHAEKSKYNEGRADRSNCK